MFVARTLVRARIPGSVDYQNGAVGMLSNPGADRAEQHAGDSAVAAAADDEHFCSAALLDKDVSSVAFPGCGGEPLRILRAEDRFRSSAKDGVRIVEGRIFIHTDARVAGRQPPRRDGFDRVVEGVGDSNAAAKCGDRRFGAVDSDNDSSEATLWLGDDMAGDRGAGHRGEL
jgi:hypothetical protein